MNSPIGKYGVAGAVGAAVFMLLSLLTGFTNASDPARELVGNGTTSQTCVVTHSGDTQSSFHPTCSTTVDLLALNVAGRLSNNSTAPTISSGFGGSPTVATNNGNYAFTVNVGSGGVATSGVIGLPTVGTEWICFCDDLTTPGVNETKMTATSASSCTVTNYNTTTGAVAAWAANDILHCIAHGL